MVFTDVPRLPSMGTEVYAGGFGIHAGGGAAITAAYLVQLGGTALLAAYLPRGPLGLELRGQLETVGVDLSLCGDAAAGLGLQTTVALVGAEDRAFVTHRAGPAAPKLSPDILQAHGVGTSMSENWRHWSRCQNLSI
jgi:sugar/nucleoside kinase (ribokinase family)